MRRPLGYRHLARIHELVTAASICRTVEDRKLFEHPAIERCAAADLAIAEEALALARERGWTLPEPRVYQWQLVSGVTDVRPRVDRILARDVFELEGIYRDTDDDDVGSLAAEVLRERRAAKVDLERDRPELALPGAK